MIAQPKQSLRQAGEWMDGLSVRERGLIFVATLGVLLFVSLQFIIVPLHKHQAALEKDFNAKLEQVKFFDKQIQDLIVQSSKDPDKDNRERLTQFKERLNKLDSSLAEVTTGLVAPREMARLMEQVLVKNRGLKVIRLESMPPAPLVEGEPASNEQRVASAIKAGKGEPPEQLIYKHGMYIELEGSYLDILRYLQALEGLAWKVFWGEVSLTSDYPTSRLTLVVYTLSLHQGWIGV